MVKALGEKGLHDIVVYDNLSTGHKDSLLFGRLVVGDLGMRMPSMLCSGQRSLMP